MDNSNLYSEDDEFAVPETQESPATFSKNIIRRLGICRTSSGTDAADPNSNTNVLKPKDCLRCTVYLEWLYTSTREQYSAFTI